MWFNGTLAYDKFVVMQGCNQTESAVKTVKTWLTLTLCMDEIPMVPFDRRHQTCMEITACPILNMVLTIAKRLDIHTCCIDPATHAILLWRHMLQPKSEARTYDMRAVLL